MIRAALSRLLLLVLIVFASPSFAYSVAPTEYGCGWYTGPGPTPCPQSSCEINYWAAVSAGTKIHHTGPLYTAHAGSPGGYCPYVKLYWCGSNMKVEGAYCVSQCSAGKEVVNNHCVPVCTGGQYRDTSGDCVCPEGQAMQNGQCAPVNPCVDGQATHVGVYEAKTGLATKQYCDGQCMVNLDFDNNSSCYYLTGNSGPMACTYWLVRTTTQCSTNNLPATAAPHQEAPEEPSPPCPEGQTQIGSNSKGDPICARLTGDPKNSTETTNQGAPVTNPDGSTTKTDSTTKTGPDGATETTTTTTTTNPDGSQVTVTTRTGNGTGDGLGDDFCEKHPDSIICQTQDFYGDCDSAFECKGDPLLCAISKEQHNRNCALFEKTNAYSELGEGGVQLDPAFESKMTQAMNVNGSGDWDVGQMFNTARQDYVNFSASCPIPQSITVKGFTVNLPQDDLCSIGRLIRLLMHAFGYLTALAVLSKGLT